MITTFACINYLTEGKILLLDLWCIIILTYDHTLCTSFGRDSKYLNSNFQNFGLQFWELIILGYFPRIRVLGDILKFNAAIFTELYWNKSQLEWWRRILDQIQQSICYFSNNFGFGIRESHHCFHQYSFWDFQSNHASLACIGNSVCAKQERVIKILYIIF